MSEVREVSEKVSSLSMAPRLPPGFNPAPRTDAVTESSLDQGEVTPAPIGAAIPVLGEVNIHNLNLIIDNTHFENYPYRSMARIH